jgi:hypothetical protein
MTPKEKAEELVDKFVQYTPAEEEFEYPHAKQCALIAVDEMLNEYPSQVPKDSYEMERHLYWIKVKNELEKL